MYKLVNNRLSNAHFQVSVPLTSSVLLGFAIYSSNIGIYSMYGKYAICMDLMVACSAGKMNVAPSTDGG